MHQLPASTTRRKYSSLTYDPIKTSSTFMSLPILPPTRTEPLSLCAMTVMPRSVCAYGGFLSSREENPAPIVQSPSIMRSLKLETKTRELEKRVQDAESERERYRFERDWFRDIVYRTPGISELAYQGPPKPPSDPKTLPRDYTPLLTQVKHILYASYIYPQPVSFRSGAERLSYTRHRENMGGEFDYFLPAIRIEAIQKAGQHASIRYQDFDVRPIPLVEAARKGLPDEIISFVESHPSGNSQVLGVDKMPSHCTGPEGRAAHPLQKGDIILKLNELPVLQSVDLQYIFTKPELPVRILREGQVQNFRVPTIPDNTYFTMKLKWYERTQVINLKKNESLFPTLSWSRDIPYEKGTWSRKTISGPDVVQATETK
ncbi:hypothetical protein F5X99DRAFT_431681 [Biscogniauxia marginata]|nr:hypothetical protein F5X99DRAFT_431681 [Biscogniauxia marginata]